MDPWQAELLGILDETGRSDGRPPWAVGLQVKWSGPDRPYDYYRFLHQVSRKYRPAYTLEIGTYRGVSAAALATGFPEGQVVTLDVEQDSAERIRAFQDKVPNLTAQTGSSLVFTPACPIDLLFIDGAHTEEESWADYARFRPMMRPGGLILMDDIHFSPGMTRMWDRIKDPKLDLGARLHGTGFGAVLKLDKDLPV